MFILQQWLYIIPYMIMIGWNQVCMQCQPAGEVLLKNFTVWNPLITPHQLKLVWEEYTYVQVFSASLHHVSSLAWFLS